LENRGYRPTAKTGAIAQRLIGTKNYCGYVYNLLYPKSKMNTNQLGRFFLVAIAIGTLAGCSSTSRFSAARDFEKIVPVNSKVDVIVDTFNGSIEVTPCDQSEIQVLAHIKTYGSTQVEADETLESLIPEIDTTAEAVRIQCNKRFRPFSFSDSVSLELKVPASWPLQLSTSNGTITTKESLAPVSIETSNGKVNVVRSAGPLRISTSNGKITIVDSTGNIQAKSSNGAIHLTNCFLEGESKLDTSNGSIEVSFIAESPMRLDAKTSNGTIRYDEKSVELKRKSKTHISGVWLGHSANQEAPSTSLELETSNGSITLKSAGGETTPTSEKPSSETTSSGTPNNTVGL